MTKHLTLIGHIRTPYETLAACPNNIRTDGPECEIVVLPEFRGGLAGLEAGQWILVLYWLETARRDLLVQRRGGRPDSTPRGTFALRSPHRPNPIAAATVQIEAVSEGRLHVRGMDCLNGTGLLDIKPAGGRA